MAAVPEGLDKVRLGVENGNISLRRLHLALGASRDWAAWTGGSNSENDDRLSTLGDQRRREKGGSRENDQRSTAIIAKRCGLPSTDQLLLPHIGKASPG